MDKKIRINRIVTNIYSAYPKDSINFYTNFLGLELVMDMEWILTFASKENPNSQISVLQYDKNEKPDNASVFISIEVSDVEIMHKKAEQNGIEIVYPLTGEPWGVKRFFVTDPNGATINILQHLHN